MEYRIDPILTKKYSNSDTKPIVFDHSKNTLEKIRQNYYENGFVVYEIKSNKTISVQEIMQSFDLGAPYSPKIYSKTDIYKSGGNKITVKEGNNHRAFFSNNEQEIHSDGTLEKIGYIKTTLLHCHRAASEGGDTIIFNSVGALHRLMSCTEQPHVYQAFFDEGALRRVATNFNNEEYIGPVFKIIGDTLISRFSLDSTCDWETGFSKNDNLKVAYQNILELLNNSNELSVRFKLRDNQGVIIANDKVAHGRTSFHDDTRLMERYLFSNEL